MHDKNRNGNFYRFKSLVNEVFKSNLIGEIRQFLTDGDEKGAINDRNKFSRYYSHNHECLKKIF